MSGPGEEHANDARYDLMFCSGNLEVNNLGQSNPWMLASSEYLATRNAHARKRVVCLPGIVLSFTFSSVVVRAGLYGSLEFVDALTHFVHYKHDLVKIVR